MSTKRPLVYKIANLVFKTQVRSQDKWEYKSDWLRSLSQKCFDSRNDMDQNSAALNSKPAQYTILTQDVRIRTNRDKNSVYHVVRVRKAMNVEIFK